MSKNAALGAMIVCYLVPILYVCWNYNSNTSVSNIICDDNCKHIILTFMVLMGIGTLFYEIQRNDTYSIVIISVLLLGIYGLISVKETNTLHYVFAFLAFMSIMFFMVRHCYTRNCDNVLLSSLILQVIMMFVIVANMNNDIFYSEVIYILNFAFYYLYLHFIE